MMTSASPPEESFADRAFRERAEESDAWRRTIARMPHIARAIGDGWRHTPQPCEASETEEYKYRRSCYLTHAPSGAMLHLSLNTRYDWGREGQRLTIGIHIPPSPDGRNRIPRDFMPYDERQGAHPPTSITVSVDKTDSQIGRDIKRRLEPFAVTIAGRAAEQSTAEERAFQARVAAVSTLAAAGLQPCREFTRNPRDCSQIEMYNGPSGVYQCRVDYSGTVEMRITFKTAAEAVAVLKMLRAAESEA